MFSLLCISVSGYAFESVEDSSGATRTRLFEIKSADTKKVQEVVEQLLGRQESAQGVEVFSVERPDGTVTFLVVHDTAEKLEQIGAAITSLERESTAQRVSLNFNDVPLNQVLATIARAYNLNIIGGEDLSQKVTIHLKDVIVDDVFDIVLKSIGYAYTKEGNVIWIVSKESVLTPLVTEIFKLEFTSADKVKEAISHLLTEKGQIKSFTNFGEEKYSDCLVVTDTADSIKAMKSVINRLDRKPRQVIIEAKFCEVTLNKDDESGLDVVMEATLTGASEKTTFPLKTDGANPLIGPVEDFLASGAGSSQLTTGTLSFENFSATLKALDSKTTVNLVASPRLSTRDGETAEIIIGDIVPIPIYERNDSTGSIEVTGYEDQSVGTVLEVTPMINDDRTVTLTVHPEVSEITSFTGPNNERPVISTREVTTTFTVENGKTFVLGGLKKNTVTNTYRQIPILGNMFGGIPVFGRLFRFYDDSIETKELLIFITPTIIDEKNNS